MREWWKEAIGYQIYPSSFGDFKKIIEKLEYLESLNINLLWISPFYMSGNVDGGYDVIDHTKIDPRYGTLDEFKTLLQIAHQKGMKVIIDLILNHTSSKHPWFKEALNGNKEKQDYYIFKEKINNWSSFFYESAWSKVANTNLHYLHIFAKEMPDLNWENKQVREEMYKIAKYWLDLGVDGFRLDALAHLAKDPFYTSSEHKINAQGYAEDWRKFSNQPHLFSYLNEFKKRIRDNYDCLLVGEVGGNISAKEALRFVNYHTGSIHMLFNFEANAVHNGYGEEYEDVVCDVASLKQMFETWIYTYGNLAWYPLYFTNHDQTRVLNQYGSMKYQNESAKMLATVLLFMGGTPFIYNGDEIGMCNTTYTSLDAFNDIKDINCIKANKNILSEEKILAHLNKTSRIHTRTCMKWDAVNTQQEDANSILNFFKKATALRQNIYLDTVLDGRINFIDKMHKDVFAFEKRGKQKLMVIANFSEKECIFAHHRTIFKVVLKNYTNTLLQNDRIFLRPFEVVLVEIE